MPKGVERAQQLSGADRRQMMEKAQQSRQQASPRMEKAEAAKSAFQARGADVKKKEAMVQKRDHAHDLKQAGKDRVEISDQGRTASKAAAKDKAAAAAKPAMKQQPQQMNMRAQKFAHTMGNMPTSMGTPKGIDTGATPQFSERTGVSFGGKG